jgi:hypothetical protein
VRLVEQLGSFVQGVDSDEAVLDEGGCEPLCRDRVIGTVTSWPRRQALTLTLQQITEHQVVAF